MLTSQRTQDMISCLFTASQPLPQPSPPKKSLRFCANLVSRPVGGCGVRGSGPLPPARRCPWVAFRCFAVLQSFLNILSYYWGRRRGITSGDILLCNFFGGHFVQGHYVLRLTHGPFHALTQGLQRAISPSAHGHSSRCTLVYYKQRKWDRSFDPSNTIQTELFITSRQMAPLVCCRLDFDSLTQRATIMAMTLIHKLYFGV